MGMLDYCPAGHWDEDGLHRCTMADGIVEALRYHGFVVVADASDGRYGPRWFTWETEDLVSDSRFALTITEIELGFSDFGRT